MNAMKTLPMRTLRSSRRRGQAMLEYSIINWVLIVALVIGVTVKMDIDGSGTGKNVIEMFLEAYQIYYDSFYFVLNMPFP